MKTYHQTVLAFLATLLWGSMALAAQQKPMVLKNGQLQQVQSGDTVDGTQVVNVPLATGVTGVLPLVNLPTGTSGAVVPVLNGANTWSAAQTFSAPSGSTTSAITATGTGASSLTARAITWQNAISGLPPLGVTPSAGGFTQCHGDNSNFRGCGGLYLNTSDDSTVTSANKGVLYGINIDIGPKVARGSTSPADDADGVVISNSGTANGTEAIYFGHNSALSSDWGAGLGFDLNAVSGQYFTGTYTYGLTFAHGTNSTFSNGGGVLLVPPPASGTTPVLSTGSDAFTPSNNTPLVSIDGAKNLVMPSATHFCTDSWALANCVSATHAVSIESNNGTAISIMDGTKSNQFTIALDTGSTNDLVINRALGAGFLRSVAPFKAPSVTVAGGLVAGATQNCINILLYGGDATGSSDNTTALTNALAANPNPAVRCVYFPAGTYKFSSAQTIGLPSGSSVASVRLVGDGADATVLDFSSGTNGLQFTLASPSHSVHIHNLAVTGGSYSASTVGIRVQQTATVANPAYSAISDLTNVNVRGDDGYGASNSFGTGIALIQASNFNISNSYISGPGNGSITSSTCISLLGSSSNIAVVFNLIGTTLNSCGTGLNYGAYVQGVTVSQSNFTGVYTGIYTPSAAAGLAQLSVVASQFNTYNNSINLLTNPTDVQITGNMFIANGATGAANGVSISAASTYTITGNTFSSLTGSNNIGVVINSYATDAGIIAGNQFNNLNTGILLNSSSQKATVGINSFSNVTTSISNLGSGNTAPVSCSAGSPTSSFAVTNGVITHC